MKELILATVLLVGLLYMCYGFGQKQERKAYTAHFVQEIETAYQQGHDDADKNCALRYEVYKQSR